MLLCLRFVFLFLIPFYFLGQVGWLLKLWEYFIVSTMRITYQIKNPISCLIISLEATCPMPCDTVYIQGVPVYLKWSKPWYSFWCKVSAETTLGDNTLHAAAAAIPTEDKWWRTGLTHRPDWKANSKRGNSLKPMRQFSHLPLDADSNVFTVNSACDLSCPWFLFWLCWVFTVTCGILVPCPRTELGPLVVTVLSLSHIQLFATPWTVTCQAPLSMEFSRQESWSGLPFPSPGYLPDPGIKPASSALAGGFFTTEPPGKLTMNFKRLNMRNFIYLWSKWQIFQEKIIDICQALEWASWLFSLWEDLQFPPRQRSTYPSAQEEKKKGNKSLTCVIVDA